MPNGLKIKMVDPTINSQLINKAIDLFIEKGGKPLRRLKSKYKNKTGVSFSVYLRNRSRKLSNVKNLIYDRFSAQLEDIYVHLDLDTRQGIRTDLEFLTKLYDEQPILDPVTRKETHSRPTVAAVVQGTGGSGKSILFRFLFLEICKDMAPKIPVMIELREFNDLDNISLDTMIFIEMQEYGAQVDREQIQLGLQHGLFTLLIDGFDEVNPNLENHVADIIIRAGIKYPDCPIIVSSRYSDRFLSWSEFDIVKVRPLARHQVVALLDKLEFDPITKTRFLNELREHIFESHMEYLEIPLLVTVMLIAYSDAGSVAANRHEFYEDVFSAMWKRHDARKEGYQRIRYSGLDKQEFVELLSAFAGSTYAKSVFSISNKEYESHLKNASSLVEIEVQQESFLRDLVTSTCVCVPDGRNFQFVHRTFQEYFAALYILRMTDHQFKSAVDEIHAKYETDNVMGILWSVNSQKMNLTWTLPTLREIEKNLGNANTVRGYKALNDGPLGSRMALIRSAFSFQPTKEELSGAIDASRDMREAIGADDTLSVEDFESDSMIFQDIENFLGLKEKLEIRDYEIKSTGRSSFGNVESIYH